MNIAPLFSPGGSSGTLPTPCWWTHPCLLTYLLGVTENWPQFSNKVSQVLPIFNPSSCALMCLSLLLPDGSQWFKPGTVDVWSHMILWAVAGLCTAEYAAVSLALSNTHTSVAVPVSMFPVTVSYPLGKRSVLTETHFSECHVPPTLNSVSHCAASTGPSSILLWLWEHKPWLWLTE